MSESKMIANEILLPEVERFLSEGKEVIIRTKGNSMMPFVIGDRDSVLLRRMEAYSVGDVVLADIGAKHYVLHRIIGILGQNVTLMGDGNIQKTESCLLSDIAGRAVEVIKSSGRHKVLRRGKIWGFLLPVRRYLLAIYRRLPWVRIKMNNK